MIPQKKNKQWILTCKKKQGAPHIGSWAAPACQCSVQMFTWWWMHWCHEKKKWSTNKNENLQLEQANQKFSVMIWTYNKYYLNSVGAKFRNCNVHVLLANEISRQSTSNAAATKTTTAESTKNVEVWSKKASTDVKFEIEEIPHYFIYLFEASKW